MTKRQLIAQIAQRAGLSLKVAERALKAIIQTIKEVLARGDVLRLRGFGFFSVARRAERMGRNFATGQPMRIPARRSPFFRPGKGLKQAAAASMLVPLN